MIRISPRMTYCPAPYSEILHSFQYGLYLHELGHTIGLRHEHQHPDRDQGVQINMNNVHERMRQWFKTIDRKELNFYGVPYDMQSVMHYGQHVRISSINTTILL